MQPCWPHRFQLLHFTLHTPHFTLYTPLHTWHFTLDTLHFTLYTSHFPPCTLHIFTLYTPQPTIPTSHSTHYIPHSTFDFLHTPPMLHLRRQPWNNIVYSNILYQTLPCLSVLLIPTVRSWLFKKGIAALGHFRSLGSFHEGRVKFLLENWISTTVLTSIWAWIRAMYGAMYGAVFWRKNLYTEILTETAI